jgi:hypothetical protein
MDPKKVCTWLVVALGLFLLIQAPEWSAALVRQAGSALAGAAGSVMDFFGSLV